ncbi:hypothetical protein [Streptomyces sp. NBC_00334]|uniref:hypothetical protein n=1 Tax=Streptomyces sp. NBC_00334 TaxID=2975713 RepID=UPI002E2A18F0|nr:hypothetical protein [Streptomyces sp. NBC_00334]
MELGEGCLEQLSGRHAPETVDAALKAAFARARSQYGWQPGPDMGSGTLVLEKNNWTATVALPGTPAQGLQAPVGVSLVCVGADSAGAPSATGTPGRPAVGPS